MKNRMKWLLIKLLAVMVAVSCWGAVHFRADASGYNISGLEEIGMVNSDFLGNGVDHSAIIYWYMNGTGKISYCLQYGYLLSSGQEFTSAESAISILSEEQVRQLRYCLYYGYQAGGYGVCPHAGGITCQEEWIPYAATQAMVWLIVADRYDDPEAVEQWGKIVADSTDYSSRVLAEYKTLYAKMKSAMEMEPPSFSNTDKVLASTYTMEWDAAQSAYTVTLTDKHGVLGLYDWMLPAGVSAVRNGSQITFTTVQPLGGEMVQFDAKSGAAANREISALLFWLPSDASKQNQVQYESVTYDPIHSYLYLKTGVRSGTFKLRKLDSLSGSEVGGAVYGVYSDPKCTVQVTTLTTDASDYVQSGELAPGTYYVREIAAPVGYLLSDEIYSIDVEAGITVSLEMEDTPTRYRFVKKDEFHQPLADCEFELVDDAGNLVDAWTTGDDGIHELVGKLIEGATYTLREVDCPLGYVKAEDYTFTVTSEGEWVELITTNARLAATVRVNKRGGGGEALNGAEFTILTTQEVSGVEPYLYQGKTYYSLKTGKVTDGSVEFDGLDATGDDEYLLVETKSVQGTTLLKEPVKLGTLPLAAMNGVSTDYVGRQQKKGGVTYLYDLTYTIVNSSNMVLPLTGEVNGSLTMVSILCGAVTLLTTAMNLRRNKK